MRRIRIVPGSTVPLKLKENERALMLQEVLMVSKTLENKLRFAIIQVRKRILEPLVQFGLLEIRELPKDEKRLFRDYEYRTTPLYDTFFLFPI